MPNPSGSGNGDLRRGQHAPDLRQHADPGDRRPGRPWPQPQGTPGVVGRHGKQQLVVLAAGQRACHGIASAPGRAQPLAAPPGRPESPRRRSMAPVPLALGDLPHRVARAVRQVHAGRRRAMAGDHPAARAPGCGASRSRSTHAGCSPARDVRDRRRPRASRGPPPRRRSCPSHTARRPARPPLRREHAARSDRAHRRDVDDERTGRPRDVAADERRASPPWPRATTPSTSASKSDERQRRRQAELTAASRAASRPSRRGR